jgi:hypothetical protein
MQWEGPDDAGRRPVWQPVMPGHTPFRLLDWPGIVQDQNRPG